MFHRSAHASFQFDYDSSLHTLIPSKVAFLQTASSSPDPFPFMVGSGSMDGMVQGYTGTEFMTLPEVDAPFCAHDAMARRISDSPMFTLTSCTAYMVQWEIAIEYMIMHAMAIAKTLRFFRPLCLRRTEHLSGINNIIETYKIGRAHV